MARRLILEEAIMVGGSSGAVLHEAINYAKEMKLTKDDTLVVVLVDGLRNYMTKHLS